MAQEQPQLQVPMGFLYNPNLVYVPNRALPLMIEGILPVSGFTFQPRFYTAPADSRTPIAAGDTVDTQLRMIPGSYIVGLRFTCFPYAPSNFAYLLRDSNTQNNFTDGKSRYINCRSLVPNGKTGAAFSLLPKPYFVGGGVIVASLASQSTTTDIACQLLLYVMEPVQSPTAPETGSIQVPRTPLEQLLKAGRG